MINKHKPVKLNTFYFKYRNCRLKLEVVLIIFSTIQLPLIKLNWKLKYLDSSTESR